MGKLRVAILGASGIVAQRFLQRLSNHPFFEVVAVIASEKTSGKKLIDIPWQLEEPRPILPNIEVINSGDDIFIEHLINLNVRLMFSSVPSKVANFLETKICDAGIHVFSNSSANRLRPGIPLIIADLNPHHLMHFERSEKGVICCSTNCTVVPVALPLKPLWDMVGFKSVKIKTEQALSGGGREVLENYSIHFRRK